jgi:acyl-CoA thioester hydrolase
MTHQIYLGDVLHAEGGAKVVWVNFPTEKSAPVPDHLRAILPET